MSLSDCMSVNSNGVLVYEGHKGELFEVVGGVNGQINLKRME